MVDVQALLLVLVRDTHNMLRVREGLGFVTKEPPLVEEKLLVAFEGYVELVGARQPCVEVFHAGAEDVVLDDPDFEKLLLWRKVTVELSQVIRVHMLQ